MSRRGERAVAAGAPESAAGEDLLALGVRRLLSPARYASPGGTHARICHRLGRRALPAAVPAAWVQPSIGRPRPAPNALSRRFSSIGIMDIESLGFIGRPLFLIGVLYARPVSEATERPAGMPAGARAADAQAGMIAADLEIVQYLARDYSEEEAVLRSFWSEAPSAELWVTFNGRSFDLPFVRLRADLYHLTVREPRAHLDLLPIARRLWGDRLPDCRLQTLERRICGRTRSGDLPGARIPPAYHEFVRSGEPWQMIEILRHNAADLVGLCDLFARAVTVASAAD